MNQPIINLYDAKDQELYEIIKDFMDTTFVRSEDPNEKISLDIFYENYWNFFNANYDGRLHSKNDIKKVLIKMDVYFADTNGIVGYKFKDRSDELTELLLELELI